MTEEGEEVQWGSQGNMMGKRDVGGGQEYGREDSRHHSPNTARTDGSHWGYRTGPRCRGRAASALPPVAACGRMLQIVAGFRQLVAAFCSLWQLWATCGQLLAACESF